MTHVGVSMSDGLDPGQILELRERARNRLTRIPGLLAVGFGRKVVGDQLTEGRALRVYVDEKKPPDALPADQVIPAAIDGVPTDVLAIPRGREFGTEDTQRHNPLLGGITITNLRPGAGGADFGGGTLGCFATIDGTSGRENIVLLTNNHVLAKNAGAVGDTVYQPRILAGSVDRDNTNPIAKTHSLGVNGAHPFTYPGESQVAYYLDCATAKLNIDISSWCDCNCGVSYTNELREINIAGHGGLEGVARAVDGETVQKSGRSTGGTTGVIEDPLGSALIGTPGVRVDNIILIRPVTPPDPAFADEGDSGSALVNERSQLIGLVFGGQDPTLSNPLAFACHIAPVLDALKITPISTQNPPVSPAGQGRSVQRVAVAGARAAADDHTVELQEHAQRTPRGRELYGAFVEHRSEIVALVNRRRTVTIAWHRNKGPTYFAHFAENARHPDHLVPSEIDGVSRSDLFERMAAVLTAEGTQPLRKAIAHHRAELVSLIDQFDDLHALIEQFGGRAAQA